MDLFLDDKRQVFFPGTTIYGVLRSARERDEPDTVNRIPVIGAKGYTLIWKPNSTEETDEYTLFFEDKVEPSLDASDIDLPQSAELRDYFKIFKFHIVLPNNLPPSHEVPFGHTRYKLEAHYNGQTIFKYFSVNRWVGLEKRNDINVKRELFTVQFFNCCQRIEVILTLSQSYYMPGEIVYVVALVTNHSWKDVLYSKISIIQTTKYWKNHHILPIKYARVIAEDTRGQIRSGEKQIWNKQPFYIPAVIPTTTSSNNPFNFFEVKYKLKMHIVIKNSNKKIMVKQRLFIGNWDKSSAHESNTPTNPSYENVVKACSLIKLENIDYIPKYIIYETYDV